MVLLFFAPESPWWLLRRGRKEEALRSIKRLGYNTESGANEAFAMMERTVEIEAHAGGSPSLLDLFKGVDLRRTIITCLVYASQNFAGNLIANQATFFFERAGMDVSIVHPMYTLLENSKLIEMPLDKLLLSARPHQLMPATHCHYPVDPSRCPLRTS